jgi:hypothetical protein
MKLSYLIASSHGIDSALNVINDIYELPSHDFEIICCSPYHIDDRRCLSLIDEKKGSVSAFNKCYKNSAGDYIVLCVDDHRLPKNILEVLDFFNSNEVSKLKLKIANLTYTMGGPGKLYWNKIDSKSQPSDKVLWPMDTVFHDGIKNTRPYNVFHFPAFERIGVIKYLDDVIFNESFIHHYVDHWLGFYEEKINGLRECKVLGPNEIFFKEIPDINSIKIFSDNDRYDLDIFQKLIHISDIETTTYNTKL